LGFYTTLQQIVYAIKKLSGSTKKKVEDIFDEWFVKATLIEINGSEIDKTVTGHVKKFFKKRISTFVKSASNGASAKIADINIAAQIKKQK